MKYAKLNSLTLGDLFNLYSDKKLNLQPTFLIDYPLPKPPSNPVVIFQSLLLGWMSNRRIAATQNAKKGYDILFDECDLISILHFIENYTALPKDESFWDLSGKYFKDLPCLVQKNLFAFFAFWQSNRIFNVMKKSA